MRSHCSSLAATFAAAAFSLLVALAPGGALADPPDGPPDLPSGLDSDGPPELPSGLVEESAPNAVAPADSPIRWRGYVDARAGGRLTSTELASRLSLAEARLHVSASGQWERVAFSAAGQLVADGVLGLEGVDLERGRGPVDLRELSVTLSPTDALDIEVGRQIITWGTGDLVFINDLFPKDWTSFMAGRDVGLLKAPSDGVRLTLYTDALDADVAVLPRHDADRIPDRRRLVSYDPMLGRLAGEDVVPRVAERDRWFRDLELAGRLSRRFGSWEAAAYGTWGFWKSPAAFVPDDPSDPSAGGRAAFPALATYGASARGPLLGGLVYAEAGHYLSLDDPDGDDPLVDNGEVRWLVGHERSLAGNLTLGAQYYAELMLDHGGYVVGLGPNQTARDEIRHVLTTRLTLRALRERLIASLFAFYSPSDADAHLRPHIAYAIDDTWRIESGMLVFFGTDQATFFGQLEKNSSVWLATRAAW